ncbi:MAG TPA: HEPN domain-containing protein [Thermoanaerobaculia bacterium]|nr:HEPN domain-containing protein [Thermoanaerobaculia bacterium]
MDEEALLVIRRWIKKAEHDLVTASVVLENKPDVTDTVCFHAQQCVEKALKAYLTLAGVHVEKTHHLLYLLDRCSAILPRFQEIQEHARALTDYAVEVRYIDDWRDIPEEEARSAVALAEEALAFVKLRLADEGGL